MCLLCYMVFFEAWDDALGFAHPTEQQMVDAMDAEGAIPISAAGQILLRSIHPEAGPGDPGMARRVLDSWLKWGFPSMGGTQKWMVYKCL